MATQTQLGKNLIAALQRGGTEEAIPFCNIKAIPITDSIAVVSKAMIKRVTNRPRNPRNAASPKEVRIIETYQKRLSADQPLTGMEIDKDGARIHYFPIITNAMCLQCHGKPGVDVKAATLDKLKTYYPQDLALGYGDNEVRGLWKVELDQQVP